ncbi:MAG: hypothetical protein IAE89_11030 [Anaerolineae bacterium]|nr:hypothetical protein [Anaerolineae bacterium]
MRTKFVPDCGDERYHYSRYCDCSSRQVTMAEAGIERIVSYWTQYAAP